MRFVSNLSFIRRALPASTAQGRRPAGLAAGAVIAASLVLAACSSTPLPPVQDATPPVLKPATGAVPAPQEPTTAAPMPAAASRVATVTLPAYLDPGSPLSRERSVYFAFDDFSVPSEYTAMLERHGRFLQANPTVAIRVEGHADERGSPEYNLALGQKRAEAVVQVLRIHGVGGNQAEAVSWGEERPQATGHDEASWARNRRADLSYPAR